MNVQHRADAALRALRELGVPDAPPHVEARRRRHMVEHLERLRKETPRTTRHQRGLRLGAAALALAALAAGLVVMFGGLSTLPDVQEQVSERVIEQGSEIKTDAGSSVQLRTELGARISVAGSSQLRLAEGRERGEVERVELERGSIGVKVPKLGAGQQFRVSTPDTLVIVHGTEFSVTVRADEQGRANTIVEVKSGRVEVRKKQAVEFLNAGSAWSSRVGAVDAPKEAHEGSQDPPALDSSEPAKPEKEGRVRQRGGEQQARTQPDAAGKPETRPTGALSHANALLSSALEAGRLGRDELALSRLNELLRRYPDSPVADSARVERFRVLKRLGRDHEAARAAEGYLEGKPDGFARDEARELGK